MLILSLLSFACFIALLVAGCHFWTACIALIIALLAFFLVLLGTGKEYDLEEYPYDDKAKER